jgi:hypothetical protein
MRNPENSESKLMKSADYIEFTIRGKFYMKLIAVISIFISIFNLFFIMMGFLFLSIKIYFIYLVYIFIIISYYFNF